MNKKLTYLLAVIWLAAGVRAQDPHFSQYHASPLTLNPAMTGYVEDDYRFSANFRSQYWSVGGPFTTGTLSYDVRLNTKVGGAFDRLAIGVMSLYDQSANGGFRNTNIGVSGAFHKALDGEGQRTLAAGFQTSFCSRRINPSGLSFASQFASGGFDRSLPSNELALQQSKNYVDLNTGLLFSSNTDAMLFYAGAALYHIGRPVVSFYNGGEYRLPMRWGIHSGARIAVGSSQDHDLFVSGSFMHQAGATDKILGLAYGYNLSSERKRVVVYGGGWYRIGDAIIPYLGFMLGKMQLGVTYDIVNSGLKLASPRTGGFELSLNYVGAREPSINNMYKGGRVF